MNQQESTVKLVVQALDASVEDLDDEVIRRLATAREHAVSAMQPQWQAAGHAGVFRNLGNYVVHHRMMTSAALLLGALVFGFIVTQHVIGQHQLEQGDAFLLGSELPPEAYLDKGFDTWLQQNAR
ncbi:DUF3619 family protein [Methylovorus menthalis]|uniref:DUF3619 family protein n=1 Tax=Methylovorus menthalis TaxID=1002227 RepID=UPI001E3E6F32|nr:DUF3619 family protein [Methylovorus menthalis]MCB4810765.1 DUF3619 family protein [Methylovorus menthalis]